MSDIISVENVRLPCDIEILDKCNLFTTNEIRNIWKARSGFDYDISNALNAKAYLEYIAYERGLLLQVNEKRRATQGQELTVDDTRKSVEQLIINKIIKLYKESLAQYQNEERIFENFFKFCKISKRLSEVTPYMLKFLEIHGDKPYVWIVAALWEYDEMKNPQKSRAVFMKALFQHPKSTEIYKAFIKTLLVEASTSSSNITLEQSESQQRLETKKILNLYNHAKKNVIDLQFLVDLLEIFEDYNFSHKIQDQIVRDLTDIFPGQELTWHTLAQRELKGYHVNDSFKNNNPDSAVEPICNVTPESGLLTPKLDKDGDLLIHPYTKLTLKRRIELCEKIYCKGAQIIKTQKMWTYYINAMIELNKDSSTQAQLKFKSLLAAFKSAHVESALTEDQYIQYIDCLKRSTDTDESVHLLLAVLGRATTIYKKSVNLWSLYLKYFIKQNNESKVRENFYKSIKKCGRDSLPLWQLYKQYLLIVSSPEDNKKVETLFQEAMKQPDPISSYFKIEYIEWLSLTRGIEYTRKVFKSLIKANPHYELYKKMIDINKQLVVKRIIEEQIEDNNFKETRKCYDAAIQTFGKSKIDLWLDYTKFEKDFGDIKRMTVLLTKAKTMLDSFYLDAFISQFDLLNLIF